MVAVSLKKILGNMIDRFPFLVARKNDYQIGKMVKIFVNKDFELCKIDGNKYEIIFDNRFGYQKSNYLPVFYYDWRSRAWVVKIEGVSILVQQNPCFELINELRGYTILDSIHKNDIVIDAGSSSGFISCYFAKKVGKLGKVVCLEPDDRACRLLELNVKVNDINNLVTVRKALYNKCTRIFIELEGIGASKLSTMRKNSTMEIETIDLHALINEFSLNEEKIKLIKLDIEGSELEVLDDLIHFVEKNAETIVCIASYHERDGMPSYRTIEEKCKNRSEILAKTIYPYHTTTFIVNSKNYAVKKLMKLPSYGEMNEIIWG